MSRSSVPNNSLSLQALPQALPQSIALYMRVSTEDQADRGTIDAQRDSYASSPVCINSPLWTNTPMTA